MVAPKKKWAAGWLSALFPGIGHLYAGAMGRGLFFMLLFAGNIFGVVLVSIEGIVPLIVLLSILIPVVWVYALFDALQTAERMNRAAARGEDAWAGSGDSGSAFARFAIIAGGLLFAVYWMSAGGTWFEPLQDGRGELIVAGALVAAGVLVFVFGGKKEMTSVRRPSDSV